MKYFIDTLQFSPSELTHEVVLGQRKRIAAGRTEKGSDEAVPRKTLRRIDIASLPQDIFELDERITHSTAVVLCTPRCGNGLDETGVQELLSPLFYGLNHPRKVTLSNVSNVRGVSIRLALPVVSLHPVQMSGEGVEGPGGADARRLLQVIEYPLDSCHTEFDFVVGDVGLHSMEYSIELRD